uniref:Uncharacterized protein n=1 Tax=Acrobeloides nanus TaxID=290746 RepID=A0A914D5S5_9BILA
MDNNSNVYGNSIPYHQQQHVYPSQNTYPSATTVPYPRYGFVRPYAPYETPNRVPTSYGQAASYNTNQHLNQYMETLFISSPQVAQMNSQNYEANVSQMVQAMHPLTPLVLRIIRGRLHLPECLQLVKVYHNRKFNQNID